MGHVPLEDLGKRSKKSLEALPLEHDDLYVSSSYDVGSSRLVLEKGKLAEVVAWLVVHHSRVWVCIESSECLALNQDIEAVAVFSVSLRDESLLGTESGLFDGIS